MSCSSRLAPRVVRSEDAHLSRFNLKNNISNSGDSVPRLRFGLGMGYEAKTWFRVDCVEKSNVVSWSELIPRLRFGLGMGYEAKMWFRVD